MNWRSLVAISSSRSTQRTPRWMTAASWVMKPRPFCPHLCAVLENESEHEYDRQRQYDRQKQPHGNVRETVPQTDGRLRVQQPRVLRLRAHERGGTPSIATRPRNPKRAVSAPQHRNPRIASFGGGLYRNQRAARSVRRSMRGVDADERQVPVRLSRVVLRHLFEYPEQVTTGSCRATASSPSTSLPHRHGHWGAAREQRQRNLPCSRRFRMRMRPLNARVKLGMLIRY